MQAGVSFQYNKNSVKVKKKEARSLYHKGYGPFYNLTIYLIIYIHTFFLKNVYTCRPEKTKPADS